MFKSTARAMLACAIVAALPKAAPAQFGFGAQSSGGCTDGSCTSQQGRPALFDNGGAIAYGAQQGSLFCGNGFGDGCDAGHYDCEGGAAAYSLNGVDLYSYDRQDPWLHGHFQRLPAYGGYNSFRPYNYRHVLAQQQVATTRGDSDVLPYSQQFWNSYRTRYLNRHLTDADSKKTDTRAVSSREAATSSMPNPGAPSGNMRVSESTLPPQQMARHDLPMQTVPSQTVPVSHANQPAPRQMPQQQLMMMTQQQQQLMMQQQQQQMMMMMQQQQMMRQIPVMAPMIMLPEQDVSAQPGNNFLQSEMYPQNGMNPQESMFPQQHLVIPQPAGNSAPAPAMVIPSAQQRVMHQVGFRRSAPAESAQPLMNDKRTDVRMQEPQPIHIYGSAILSSESPDRP